MNKKDKLVVMNKIRLAFRYSDTLQGALKLATHPTIKGARGGARYICVKCKVTFRPTSIQVDHIEPVVPIGVIKLDMDFNNYIDRIFCSQINLQVLCIECHLFKSNDERKQRKGGIKKCQI